MDPKIIYVGDSKLPFLLVFSSFADVIPSGSASTLLLQILVVCAHEISPKNNSSTPFNVSWTWISGKADTAFESLLSIINNTAEGCFWGIFNPLDPQKLNEEDSFLLLLRWYFFDQ